MIDTNMYSAMQHKLLPSAGTMYPVNENYAKKRTDFKESFKIMRDSMYAYLYEFTPTLILFFFKDVYY